MVLGDILVWWYTVGWRERVKGAEERLDGIVDYFSIGLLVKTMFAPFRQISAGRVDGPLNIQVRAFFDRLISRIIGAVTRLIVICIGAVTLVVAVVFTGVALLLWAATPLLPLLGAGLFILGWMPWIR